MNAMRDTFGQGYTTADLRDPEGKLQPVTTEEFGEKVIAKL
jgi:isocitrate dehydrogenase